MKPLRPTTYASPRSLVWVALFAVALATPCITTAQNSSPPTAEQQQLIKAQTENYQAQTAKLKQEQSWWEKLLSYGGSLAVLVAVISLILNYSSTLRTQRDAQFLEALKRFGDKDSPSVRSSAAGLLAKLSNQRGILFRWRRPNFDIALDQLMAGSQLEDNPVCLTSIKDALRQLTTYSPLKAIEKIRNANFEVQKDLVKALAAVLATQFVDADTALESTYGWGPAAASTPYDKEVLYVLVNRHLDPTRLSVDIFRREFKSAGQEFSTVVERSSIDDAERIEYRIAAQKALRLAGDRLNLNVEIFTIMLNTDPFHRLHLRFGTSIDLALLPITMTLEKVFLVKADLTRAKLQGLNFAGAQLQGTVFWEADLRGARLHSANLEGAWLSYSNLQKADLWSADLSKSALFNANLQEANLGRSKLLYASANGADLTRAVLDEAALNSMGIDEETKLENSNWWRANFEGNNRIDTGLLEKLFSRYGNYVPQRAPELHVSVRKFVEEKRAPANQQS